MVIESEALDVLCWDGRSEMGGGKSEVGYKRSEVEPRMSDVGSQRSTIRDRGSEVRKWEVRRGKSGNGRRSSTVGDQRWEVGGRKLAIGKGRCQSKMEGGRCNENQARGLTRA